jgi:hypothetical protein
MAIKDDEILISALRREREEVHQRLMQLDRIIGRVKSGEYAQNREIQDELGIASTKSVEPVKAPQISDSSFPKTVDIKVQVLRVFDIDRKALKLKEIQAEYSRLSGSRYNIREIVRSLHKGGLLRLMKEKDAMRGIYWVKTEWVENDQLLEEFKPEGFDILYRPENLEYE